VVTLTSLVRTSPTALTLPAVNSSSVSPGEPRVGELPHGAQQHAVNAMANTHADKVSACARCP
jgi:hypothetical protein